MKLGRFAEGEIDEKEKRLQIEEEVAKSISTGLRCEVTISKSLPKRGVVMYIGKCVCLSLYLIYLFRSNTF